MCSLVISTAAHASCAKARHRFLVAHQAGQKKLDRDAGIELRMARSKVDAHVAPAEKPGATRGPARPRMLSARSRVSRCDTPGRADRSEPTERAQSTAFFFSKGIPSPSAFSRFAMGRRSATNRSARGVPRPGWDALVVNRQQRFRRG